MTFGLNKGNNYSAEDITFDETGNVSYTLLTDGAAAARVSLHVKGIHNVMNSLAAIACAMSAGMDMDQILAGLSSFGGTHRRFEYKGKIGNVSIIDDYAHHPSEIRATLAAADQYPHDELWLVFQPHTYTRTLAFLHDFADALAPADHIILADIYAAREPDTGKVSSGDIADLLKEAGSDTYYFHSFQEIEQFLLDHAKGHDMIITMGAGNVVTIGEDLLS